MVLFIMLYKVVLTFETLVEILSVTIQMKATENGDFSLFVAVVGLTWLPAVCEKYFPVALSITCIYKP